MLLSCSPFVREAGLWAGSREDQAVFKPALPGWTFLSPGSSGPPGFKTEWWYYNGHLQDGEGRHYGYQLTFFRVGIGSGPVSGPGSRWRIRERLWPIWPLPTWVGDFLS